MIFFRLFFGWILQVAPFAVLCFLPFTKQMRISYKRALGATSGLFLIFGAAFALGGCSLRGILPPNQQLFNAVNIVFMMTLIPCFLWYMYVVKAPWPKKVFVFSYSLTGALIITSIGNFISTRLYLNVGGSDGLPYREHTPLILLLLIFVFLPPLILILRRYYQPVADSFTAKENIYISFLSVALFALLASGLSYIDYNELYHPMSLFLYTALLITFFVIYAICFRMLGIVYEKLIAQKKYDEVQRQLTIQEAQYRQITGNMENTRRMRHDLRHHLLTIQGFLKSGEVEQAEQYLSQTIELSEDYEIVKLCGNAVVNLLVSYYQALAKEQGVQFSARIAIPDDLPILDADLSVVIGNLLENALYATGREQGAFIRFNMICSGKMLAVTVDNSFSGTVRMSGEKYLSTKKNHTGYGLESVEAIVEKYSGGVEFAHEGKVFHSSVMMGLHPPMEGSPA